MKRFAIAVLAVILLTGCPAVTGGVTVPPGVQVGTTVWVETGDTFTRGVVTQIATPWMTVNQDSSERIINMTHIKYVVVSKQ